MALPADYLERVYAGVLGKIIGVYLGRPFEGWLHERILAELGEVRCYVHERLGKPLVVTDDDISGTFAFARALEDNGFTPDLTAARIGDAWLNYIVEGRTILWWGGVGNSTEHTAFVRLANGIDAPRSGSIALNGRIVAEQIGAQIFVDGWAMAAPGDPELAADLARRAASVSHDGEAIYGAQVIAAMESLAFVERDLGRLLDAAVALIPRDCAIARMIADLRGIRAAQPDWRAGFRRFRQSYNYELYPGNCHMVPNHGVIVLALLYGDDDFQKTLSIANTCGWDTDCNSGNAGCLMGIKNSLAGIDAGPDWRGPVADRLYVSTADGGRTITDAATEACRLAAAGHGLAEHRAAAGPGWRPPKQGARFHFELPGSVQGFRADDGPETRGTVALANVEGHSRLGSRSLKLACSGLAAGVSARAGTPVFVPPQDLAMPGYGLQACPALYPGQLLEAEIEADAANRFPLQAGLYVKAYGSADAPVLYRSPAVAMGSGARRSLAWRVPDTAGAPVYEAGVEAAGERGASGALYLDRLWWTGEPDAVLGPQADGGTAWRRAWVDATSQFISGRKEAIRVAQNRGTGLLIQGARDWRDVEAGAEITVYMARSWGLAIRVQGLRRYAALLVCDDGRARLVRVFDRERTVLAEAPFCCAPGTAHNLKLRARGEALAAAIDSRLTLEAPTGAPADGAVALVCEEGTIGTDRVVVRPAPSADGDRAPGVGEARRGQVEAER